MSLRHTIGSAIKEARILEGITRDELAERCGLSFLPDFIKGVENGEINVTVNGAEHILSKLKYGECYRFVKVDNTTHHES